ncbi:hypothetical protein [Rossellomorea marisflavi]|uniref:hypothetical protein n=1 Tax=Rossellomorea marisflavi TaxID=189381 RepID=UPI0011E78386|nr:hypothetical protein [Rossellomorea marisflavi]TYO68961.1 hypothetical protein DQ398_004156 [Rossellomorea marisflavi]
MDRSVSLRVVAFRGSVDEAPRACGVSSSRLSAGVDHPSLHCTGGWLMGVGQIDGEAFASLHYLMDV